MPARTTSDDSCGVGSVRRVVNTRRSGGLPVFVWAALAMAATRPGPWERRKESESQPAEPAAARRSPQISSASADLTVDDLPRTHGDQAIAPLRSEHPAAPARATAGMKGFSNSVRWVLTEGVVAAKACGDADVEYRSALCAWEDRLFARFRQGHEIIAKPEADVLIAEIFAACDRPAPALELVPGFPDPQIGGYADVAGNRILIEDGFLYRFLVLHEVGHILVPEDRCHGPVFIYVLQTLYRICLGIPEDAIRASLEAHGLPSYTYLPN